jgi:hypothetical protein
MELTETREALRLNTCSKLREMKRMLKAWVKRRGMKRRRIPEAAGY